MHTKEKPILYSFRRCPYAIRARLAIIFAQQSVDLVEIDLKNKSKEFILLSPKATVPVLKTKNAIIDESLDIMQWALNRNNPQNIVLHSSNHELINSNDQQFKVDLDHYKYADRFPTHDKSYYQQLASEFPALLNTLLQGNVFLIGNQISLIDIAIFPFIRQFSFVDKKWFDAQDWPHLQRWLTFWLNNNVFQLAFNWGR